MSLTVISHFYNEEYLLGWWLRHHREIADHGILIDYASTDRSVEIIRELAPDWEIVPSRNREFGAAECDAEVMDIESRVSGYKIALNTTEFLYLNELPTSDAATVPACVMVDTRPRVFDLPPAAPLSWSCHTGFFPDAHPPVTVATWGRSRVLHRHQNGGYLPGRHVTRHATTLADGLILWYGFAPWTPAFVKRKLQIQHRIPERDKQNQYGVQHLTDNAGLGRAWETVKPLATDLRDNPRYSRFVGASTVSPGAPPTI